MTDPNELAEEIKRELVVFRHYMKQYYWSKAMTEVRTSVWVSGSRPQGQKRERDRLKEDIIPLLNSAKDNLNNKIDELTSLFQKAKATGAGYKEAKNAVVKVINALIEIIPSAEVNIKPSALQGDTDLLKILRKKTKTRIKVLKKDKKKIEKKLKKLVKYMKRTKNLKSRYKTFKSKGLKCVLHIPQAYFSIDQNRNIRIDIYKLDDLKQRIEELERLLPIIKSAAKRYKKREKSTARAGLEKSKEVAVEAPETFKKNLKKEIKKHLDLDKLKKTPLRKRGGTSKKSIHCPYCGKTINKNANHCPYCGSKL